MSVNASLRKFHRRDLDQVFTLVLRTIDASYPPFYSPTVIDYFKKYHQREKILHDAERGWTVVLEDEREILATGTLLETNIRRVFVDPLSQRRGYGRLIMRELEAKAVEKGLKFVDLDASLFAKNFYLDLHYVIMKHGAYPLTKNDILGYYKMAKSFLPPNIPRWELNNTWFKVLRNDGSDAEVDGETVFEFVQKENLIYGEYRGGKIKFGEINGILEGDMIEFSYVQENLDGKTDHARKIATIRRNPEGKIQLIRTSESNSKEEKGFYEMEEIL